MFKSGLTHSTVSCYISGLSFHNKINELDDNTQKFVVRKLIDGIKRSKSPQKDSRTTCVIAGIPDEQIKTLGRWKSGAYLRYIRIPFLLNCLVFSILFIFMCK